MIPEKRTLTSGCNGEPVREPVARRLVMQTDSMARDELHAALGLKGRKNHPERYFE
jgi:hypothetical protein